MDAATINWHYILTLGVYPDQDSSRMEMRTFTGNLLAPTAVGRGVVYRSLRDNIAKEQPEFLDAVVIHSSIEPDLPPL